MSISELDPQIQELLAGPLAPPPGGAPAPQPQALRRDIEEKAALLGGPPVEVESVWDLHEPVGMRVYEPAGAHGAVLFLHGGGWVVGSPDSHDRMARRLAVAAGANVISVDYSLAPEHPFPVALRECETALAWARERFGGQPLAVSGDSAGGNLAAVLARHDRRLAFQLLFYPVCDMAMDTPSYESFAAGYGLTAASMHWFAECYGGDPTDPDVSPLRATDLAGVAPAHVVLASHDVLRDEGRRYAERLDEAGVAVTVAEYPGTLHGFLRWTATVEVARLAIEQAGGVLRAALR